MHDMYEGVAVVHLKCLLVELVQVKKLFTLKELNARLKRFPFGYCDVGNKPLPLKELPITDRVSLGQNGNNYNVLSTDNTIFLWQLPRCGACADCCHWLWVMWFQKTILIGRTFCFCWTSLTASSLQWSAKLWQATWGFWCGSTMQTSSSYIHVRSHQSFIIWSTWRSGCLSEYIMILKWKLIIINRHGPLARMNALRYEAKHRYFKKWATISGNFKNISKSLADHHQRYLCYLMASDTYLDASPSVGPGKYELVRSLASILP